MSKLLCTSSLLALVMTAGGCSNSPSTNPAPATAATTTGAPAQAEGSPAAAGPASAPSSAASSPQSATDPAPGTAPITSSAADLPLAAVPAQTAQPLPRPRTPEELLRAEVSSWRKTPYRDNGNSRSGIGNAQFVRAICRGALDLSIPDSYDEQIRTGKLVARDALGPGDLLFFEGKGIGPFRAKSVGLFLGRDQVALADKEAGVTVARFTGSKWDDLFKTARRVPSDPNAAAPTFDAGSYGSTSELLREVAKGWSGTLYKQGGTTFDGIGNDEFIRNIYEAIYDTELEGAPKQWATMGKAVKRDALQAGDIILYEAVGVGKLVNQRHAGMYISNGEFVHSVKGSAVMVSKLNDARWKNAYVAARRIDPDELARAAERRADITPTAAGRGGEPPTAAGKAPGTSASGTPLGPMSDYERQLRDATEPWKGTPYKLGGNTKSGVDCSAFVRAVYQDVYGVQLPRTAEEQERLGAKIDRRGLAPGDLVFFRTQGMGPLFKSRHVGLYLGNGEFAQASGRRGVNVARLDNRYWNKKYEGARRLPKG